MPSRLQKLAAAGALAGLYFVAGKLALRLAFVHTSASAVWPSSGIALAALLLFGRGLWPAVFVGAFLVNATTAGSLAACAGIASGSTLAAVIGAWLVERYAGGVRLAEESRTVFRFAFLAALGTVVSASIGVLSLVLDGSTGGRDLASIWLTWWTGDTLGDLVVAPVLLLWALPSPSVRPPRRAETAAFTAIATFVALVVFTGAVPGTRPAARAFLSLPPLVWAAFRLGPRVAATGAAGLSALAVWGTLHGHGPFVQFSPNVSLLQAQAFTAVSALTTLIVAAVVRERNEAVARLQEAHDALEQRVADRTEDLRRSEVRYRAVVENSRSLFCTHDLEGRILSINPAALSALGYAAPELLGHSLEELLAPAVRDRFPDYLERVRTQGAADGILRVVIRKGEERLWSYRNVLHQDGAGAPYVIGFSLDITDRIKAESAREELLWVIAHDFQSPLTVIRGYAEMLLTLPHPEEMGRMLSAIDANARRLSALVRDTLTTARLESGGLVLARGPVDVAGLVRDVVAAWPRDPGFDLGFAAPPGPLVAEADGPRLQQVLENLIGNAIKYSEGRQQVQVSVQADGDEIEVSVADQGRGIAPDDLPKLFQRFTRLESARRGGVPGTGLGLYICRSIVDAHGGRIWAESAPGAGSTFRFTLPVAPAGRAGLSRSGGG